MLYINDKKFTITKKQIKVVKFNNGGINGFCIRILLEFNHNNKKGYLDIDAGFEKSNNIENFINREYIGVPFDDDDQYIDLEVFDTEKFLATEIESEIILKIKNMIDNKIVVSLELNDKLINIKFEGTLDIINVE